MACDRLLYRLKQAKTGYYMAGMSENAFIIGENKRKKPFYNIRGSHGRRGMLLRAPPEGL